jgi:lipopolysaccharide export system permease protein
LEVVAVNTLDRYITKEVSTYVVGALAVVVLALIGGALYEVLAPLITRGADPWIVSQYLAYRVPEALVRGLPLAFLFALLLVLSRMGEESELKAMLAGGVAKLRILFPILLLGTLLFVVGLVAADTLVPRSLQQGQSVLREAILQKPRALLQPGTRLVDAYQRVVYIGEVGNDRIGQIRVIKPEEILSAKEGRFIGGSLVLLEGLRITYADDGRARTVARFAKATVPLVELSLEPPGGLFSLTVAELRQRIAQYREQRLPYHAEMTALQRKWAEPAAVYSFAIFAVGLSFFLLGGSRSLGMLGVVILTFAYYATWSIGRIMGEQGVISPFLAAWSPNLLYALAGVVLLRTGKR